MSVREGGRLVVALAGLLLIQLTLGLDLRIAGAHPDLILLAPISAGFSFGPSRGALLGFLAGLMIDLFLPTPFGLSALVGCLVGYGVGAATLTIDKTVWWFAPLIALGTSALAVVGYAVVGSLLGDSQFLHIDLAAIAIVVGLINAVLAPWAVRISRWVFIDASQRRTPISIGPAA